MCIALPTFTIDTVQVTNYCDENLKEQSLLDTKNWKSNLVKRRGESFTYVFHLNKLFPGDVEFQVNSFLESTKNLNLKTSRIDICFDLELNFFENEKLLYVFLKILGLRFLNGKKSINCFTVIDDNSLKCTSHNYCFNKKTRLSIYDKTTSLFNKTQSGSVDLVRFEFRFLEIYEKPSASIFYEYLEKVKLLLDIDSSLEFFFCELENELFVKLISLFELKKQSFSSFLIENSRYVISKKLFERLYFHCMKVPTFIKFQNFRNQFVRKNPSFIFFTFHDVKSLLVVLKSEKKG